MTIAKGVPFDSSSQVEGVEPSGRNGIDSLIEGVRWVPGAGGATTLTYSFPRAGAEWAPAYNDSDEPYSGFQAFSPAQQQAARAALQLWSDLADLRFVEVKERSGLAGDLRFGRSELPTTAYAYPPDGTAQGGDIWLGPFYGAYDSYPPGTYEFQSLVHEIGHALGLKHPHEPSDVSGFGATLPTAADWIGASTMSYASYPGDTHDVLVADIFPETPMGLDVGAIQYLYGADTTTRAGDTVYSWAKGERLFETIWDAGGKDTIDWSNQSTAATISLLPDSWSKLGKAYTWSLEDEHGTIARTLHIAAGVTIENAEGGKAADTIAGNKAANTLAGHAGDDRLYGRTGKDRLDGGSGDDRLHGGSGDDKLSGGSGHDLLTGASGADTFMLSASGEATITDFDRGDGDRLHLGGIIKGYASSTRQLADFVHLDRESGGTAVGLDRGGQGNFSEIALLQDERIGRLSAKELGLPDRAPIAYSDRASTDEDTPLRVYVLANHRDRDGDPLTLLDASLPQGQGRLVAGATSFVLDPRAAWGGLDAGETARVTVTYHVSDGEGGIATGRAFITVHGLDDAGAAADATDLFGL
jgi:serralysin